MSFLPNRFFECLFLHKIINFYISFCYFLRISRKQTVHKTSKMEGGEINDFNNKKNNKNHFYKYKLNNFERKEHLTWISYEHANQAVFLCETKLTNYQKYSFNHFGTEPIDHKTFLTAGTHHPHSASLIDSKSILIFYRSVTR